MDTPFLKHSSVSSGFYLRLVGIWVEQIVPHRLDVWGWSWVYKDLDNST